MNSSDKISKIAKINEDKLTLLSLNKDFIKSLSHWRKKIGIDNGGFKKKEKVESLYKEIDKTLLVTEATEFIMKEFNISKNYQLAITNKILYGKFNRIPLNHSINIKGRYLSINIYKKPTKYEWIIIKKEVDGLLGAIESNNFKFLEKFNYPDGTKVSKPKRNLKRDLKILKKSKLLKQRILTANEEDGDDKYSDADIEAEVFPEGKIEQAKKNRANIRKIRSRMNRDIKRTT